MQDLTCFPFLLSVLLPVAKAAMFLLTLHIHIGLLLPVTAQSYICICTVWLVSKILNRFVHSFISLFKQIYFQAEEPGKKIKSHFHYFLCCILVAMQYGCCCSSDENYCNNWHLTNLSRFCLLDAQICLCRSCGFYSECSMLFFLYQT